jgi:tetratricopeptide (TPR) repeat protein
MPRQFQPTDSRDFFVGRMSELQMVTQLLHDGQGKWLVQILGEGGIGKTRFLERLREKLRRSRRSRDWRCTEIVDFYKVSTQTTFGLLAEIARKVDPEQFQQFESQRQIYEEVIKNQPDVGLQQEAFHRVANAFFDDWRALLKKGRRVVLLFDTCEEMHLLSVWVGRTLLPRLLSIQKELQAQNGSPASALEPQIVAVFAGRTALTLPPELEDSLLVVPLPPLSQEEVQEFFEQASWFPRKISKKQLVELNNRCGGRPLYVALSYDWLANQMGLVEDLINTPGPFSEKLVEWILQLRNIHSNVILAAALAWRRMEAGLLAKLLQLPDVAAAEKLFEELSRYSFVKYRPPDPAQNFAGSFQLHDVMRDLVNRHLWPREGRWTQQAMLQGIIAWYEERIGNRKLLNGEELPPTDELRALLAEYLYYQLSSHALHGSQIGETLFKKASYYLDISLGELLNYEISRFEKSLPNHRVDQLRFQQALIAFRRDNYAWAGELWHALTRLPDCDNKLQATSHMLLVELEAYTAKHDEALEHAEAAETIYRQLLQAPERGPGFYDLIRKELGQLYNNRGYIYRAKSEWARALEFYNNALDIYQQASESYRSAKNVARTLNNIGFVYFQKNDFEQALTYVGRALQIRRQLGIPYELGLGHNTLGMIMENGGRFDEAADLYLKAKYYFEVSHSDRGLALVYINLGRLKRITNDFEKAFEYLRLAHAVLKEKNDLTYLIVALNEIGCAYRQRGGPEDRRLAEEFLNESLKLSRDCGDRKAEADNIEDLSILYYQWGKELKQKNNLVEAERYFQKVRQAAQQVLKIAEADHLPFLKAKVERTWGDVDFEKQDYKKAFHHLFKACEVLANAMKETKDVPMHYQRRLAENADRLQERLHTLPDLNSTRQYAQMLLYKFEKLPANTRQGMSMVESKLRATLQLSSQFAVSFI